MKKLNALIKNESENFVNDLSGKVGSNPQNLNHYFEEAQTAMSKGQKALHQRLIDKLDEVIVSKSRIMVSASIS